MQTFREGLSIKLKEVISDGLAESIVKGSCDTLTLNGKQLTSEDGVSLGHALANNKTLRVVDVSDNNLGDTGGKALVDGLLKNTTLVDLSLRANRFSSAVVLALKSILTKPESRLSLLDISDNPIGFEGATIMAECLKDTNNKLQILALRACGLPKGKGIGKLFANVIRTNNNLQGISLKENQLDADDLKPLTEALIFNTHITFFDFSHNDIGVLGAEYIQQWLKNNVMLTELRLSDCGLQDTGARILISIIQHNKNSELTDLHLSGNQLQASAKEIAEFLKSPSCPITYLDISHNNFGEAGGLIIFEALLKNRSLKTLKIGHNQLKGVALGNKIAQVIEQNHSLTELDLQGNPLGKDAVPVINALAVGKSCIVNINLESCGLTEEGYQALSLLVKNHKKLKDLFIKNNPCLNEAVGAAFLAAVSHNPRLAGISLHHCLSSSLQRQVTLAAKVPEINKAYADFIKVMKNEVKFQVEIPLQVIRLIYEYFEQEHHQLNRSFDDGIVSCTADDALLFQYEGAPREKFFAEEDHPSPSKARSSRGQEIT